MDRDGACFRLVGGVGGGVALFFIVLRLLRIIWHPLSSITDAGEDPSSFVLYLFLFFLEGLIS